MNPVSYTLVICLFAFSAPTGSLKAAVSVYFYGINSSNDTNPNPAPLQVGEGSGGMYIATGGGVNLSVAGGFGDPFLYRSDATLIPSGHTGNVLYYSEGFLSGAIVGDQNYAYLKFVKAYYAPFESIGQFFFDELGNGRLVAIATTNTGTTAANIRGNSDGRRITVTEGASAIAAAHIPETSSVLLLGIGVLGVVACRRRPQTSTNRSHAEWPISPITAYPAIDQPPVIGGLDVATVRHS